MEYWQGWTEINEPGAKIGQLRWNPREVFSVAIDGQHRLAAIKSFYQENEHVSKIDDTQIPVILLILDKRMGVIGDWADGGQVTLLRSLFIDLNKHAKQVSRTRQIILDDKDPHSLCVRALIGNSLVDGIKDLTSKEPCLPLSIVDWHREQAKFDEGPYIGTVLGMDWIVSKALGGTPIRDFMDYREVRRQVDAFEKSLGVDLGEAKERIESIEQFAMEPFAYSDGNDGDELGVIRNGFVRVWCPALVKLFSELLPYESFIALRKDEDTLSVDFVTWYYLLSRKNKEKGEGQASREYRQFLNHLATRQGKHISEGDLKDRLLKLEAFKKENLAFNVIFQKAVIEAYIEYKRLEDDLDMGELGEGEIAELDEILEHDAPASAGKKKHPQSDVEKKASGLMARTGEFVLAMNQVIAKMREILRIDCRTSAEKDGKSLWLGTLLTADGNIDFTAGAAHRAKDIILWIAYLWKCKESKDKLLKGDYEEFIDGLDAGAQNVHRRLLAAITRYAGDQPSSAVSRILKGQDKEYAEKLAKTETKVRLVWIARALGIKALD
jgi:hypothetical protein